MSNEKKIKWKDTLNLPKTEFPMKAQLNRKEPEILKKWQETDLFESILKKRKGSPLFVFHDGPPYANGNIHMGHALNKILKDFIIKGKSMEGHTVRYIPGWDCHGLPIEIKVDQTLGTKKKDMNIIAVREECRKYAEKYVKIQRDEFIRLGIFGDWKNPYTTLEPNYEATVINFFKSFVKNGNVHRKKRPVYWCTSCKTALAEAEVEYENHISPSIYVKFRLNDIPDSLQEYGGKDIFVLIWTTTPWTIPANLAIAVHPQYDYCLFHMNGEQYIAAVRLVPVLADILKSEYKIVKEFKGEQLEGLNAGHPLYDRNSLLITQDYVVLDQGTGCVHTAPGHGEEDYRAGLQYHLDIYSPVEPDGSFDSSTGKYKSKNIFNANPEIVADLRNAGRLLHTEDFEHSYPHCWRCKKPVIFRATEQWFIAMDTAGLRQKALEEIKRVKWLPAWGQERIYNMVENRPDWCISRQRDWGVPIPAFYCKNCHEPFLNVAAVEKTEQQFRTHGSNSWYSKDISKFLPEGSKCAKCGSENFEKGLDIIDVWFESGSSFGVLDFRPDNRFPSEIYLEGGDQHRGWFHSSLLVAVSSKNRAPYNTVITNGWVLDSQGRAMSKSLGNVIHPQDIIKDMGAEILRLWVAMVNYREDIRISDEVLARISESYRKIRNTWRFMLGVLADFEPVKDEVIDKNLREVDNFILHKLQEVKQKVLQSYKDFEYHTICHTISNFFTIELSSFYLNFMKDILYCSTNEAQTRRAAQTVIFKLLKDTLLLMAPILTFTAEEAWEFLPAFPGKEDSVHLQLFPAIEEKYLHPGLIDKEKWSGILALRDRILKEIEAARNLKTIGDSLEAEITLHLNDTFFDLVTKHIDLFKEICVVAKITAAKAPEEKIIVTKSTGSKCPRCWNWFEEDTSGNTFPEICPRCARVAQEKKLEAEK